MLNKNSISDYLEQLGQPVVFDSILGFSLDDMRQ